MRTAFILLGVTLSPVAIVAVSRAAVTNQFIASGVYTLTVTAILACLMAAFASNGRTRNVATGSAVFAIGYFAFAVFLVDAWEPIAQLLRLQDAPRQMHFSTTYGLVWAYDEVSNRYMELWTGGGTRAPAWHLMTKVTGAIPKSMDLSTLHTFVRTGQCMFTWFAGVGGAAVGGWMWKQNQSHTEAS